MITDDLIEDAHIVQEDTKSKQTEKQEDGLDFLEQDYSQKFTTTKTKEVSTDGEDEERGDNKDSSGDSGSKPKDNGTNNKESTDVEFMDYEDLSEFVVELVDIGFSYGLKMISGEKTTNKFELKQNKKYKLTKMLSRILAKRNVGLSIEIIFCVTLVMCYIEPVKEAIEARERNNKLKENNPEPRKSKYEDNDKETKEDDNTEQTQRRTSGRPRKQSTEEGQ